MEKKNYEIFISYRRDGGDDAARLYRDRLTNEGFSCFYDFEDMRSGEFNEQLYSSIDECADFLLILPPNGLDRCVNDDDWVRLEIAHALKKGKNIIPVMLRGFKFPNYLPEDIDGIRIKQGVSASNEYFDATIEKIIKLLETKKQPPQPSLPQKIADEKSKNSKERISQINTLSVADENCTPSGNKRHLFRKTISCSLLSSLMFTLLCFIIMGKLEVGTDIFHFPWAYIWVFFALFTLPGILGFFGIPSLKWLGYRSKSYKFYWGISTLITGSCIAYYLYKSDVIKLYSQISQNAIAMPEKYNELSVYSAIIIIFWIALSASITAYLSYLEYSTDRKLSQISNYGEQIEEATQEILKDNPCYKTANDISGEYGLYIIRAFNVPKYDRYRIIGIYNTSDDESFPTGLLFTDSTLYFKSSVKSKSKRISYSKIKRIEKNGKCVILYGKLHKIATMDINNFGIDVFDLMNKCKGAQI